MCAFKSLFIIVTSSFTNHNWRYFNSLHSKAGTPLVHMPLCLQLCSCLGHCWVKIHPSFNCILPTVILNTLQTEKFHCESKHESRVQCRWDFTRLTDMFCMIQCLLLEMSRSWRLDRVDSSLKAELLVLRKTHTQIHLHTQLWFTSHKNRLRLSLHIPRSASMF